MLFFAERKLICATFTAVLFASGGICAAHELGARVDLPSKIERFASPVGSVKVLQYYGIGHLDGQGGAVRFRVGRLSIVGQPTAILALEVRVSSAGTSHSTYTGFVDSDDLGALMKALGEIERSFKQRRALGDNAEMAEVEFTAGSVRFAGTLTRRPQDRDRFLIIAGNPTRASAALDASDLSKVQALLTKALEKVAELNDAKNEASTQ